ncbi:MAG: hypothetical protein ACKOSS_09905 [Planctomycetia bacterium]
MRIACLAAALAALLSVVLPPSLARAEGVPLEDAKRNLEVFGGQLKDRKLGNEDLNGSIEALASDFYNIASPAEKAPDALPDGADEEARKAHAAATKAYEEALKKQRAAVRDWQHAALDLIFRALKLVVYDAKTKSNLRDDVNIKASLVLGDLLGNPKLAEGRDAKELEKLREGWSKQLRDLLAGELEEPKQDYQVPVAVLENTFAALGKINDPKTVAWLLENYSHTNNAPAKVERLKAAHKAMVLFKGIKGDLRFQVVEKFATIYSAAEATANNAAANSGDAKQKTAAAASKKFWDDVKTDAIAVVNYYATGPDGAAPANAEGQALTTMKDLFVWFGDHSRKNRAPWLDEKADAAK